MVTLAFNPDNKNQLAELLEQVAHGETIVLTKDGVEVARITPLSADSHREKVDKWHIGTMQGKFTVDDTFDDPLPDDIQKAFDGNS